MDGRGLDGDPRVVVALASRPRLVPGAASGPPGTSTRCRPSTQRSRQRPPLEVPGGASRRTSTAARGCAWGSAPGGTRRVGWSSHISARSAILLLSAFWQVDPFTAEVLPASRRWTTSARSPRSRSTAPSRCGRSGWRRRVTIAVAPFSPSRLPTRWPGSSSPRTRRAARRRDPHPTVGELPRQGLLLADHPRRERSASTSSWKPSDSAARATRSPGRGSSSRTCGSPT